MHKTSQQKFWAGQEDSNKTPQPNRKVSSQDPITMN